MSLFGRKPNPNTSLQEHARTVESILQALNRNPAEARISTGEGEYGWAFNEGSALIEIYLTDKGNRQYFQVLSPITILPIGGLLPLYRRLLELNLTLTNASLGVYNEIVYVYNERPLQGLDPVEADFIIKQIAQYADDLDNSLVDEFGGRLYNHV